MNMDCVCWVRNLLCMVSKQVVRHGGLVCFCEEAVWCTKAVTQVRFLEPAANECPDKGKCFHAHAKIKCKYRVFLANLSRSLEEFNYCVVYCYRLVYRRVVVNCALFVWCLACSRYEALECRHGLFPTTTNHPTEDPKTVFFHSFFPLLLIISFWCECRTTGHGWSSPVIDVQCWQRHGCISSEISFP